MIEKYKPTCFVSDAVNVFSGEKDDCVVNVSTQQENHDVTKPSYALGNVTFVANISLDLAFTKYFIYIYSFGDNTTDTHHIEHGLIRTVYHDHNYTDVCNNCKYEVTAIAFSDFDRLYYCRSNLTEISVISEC